MPTNGVGLGHAQRCALIANALGPGRPPPVFAAFPSCMRLVKSHGFDVMPLVGRSPLHAQSHEHDLVNHLRLRALSAGARTLVFDGGYIFDSVYRTVLEGSVSGVWIRRGLWQGSQDNSVALDREKAFDRVIVPCEGFEELNQPYSRGDHLFTVGPVVQSVALSPGSRDGLRAALADRFGRSFDRLAVSLLGGGVAADRSAQIQALCGLFERRSDTLHLVLVWPNATLEPGWFDWRNSRVVRTLHAAVLAAAADVAITAAGYNSFHEVLYNRIPAIFVPQTGSFMDDQRARARAACDRGLAAMVESSELMKLERLIARYLDDGEAEAMRAKLAATDLPELGHCSGGATDRGGGLWTSSSGARFCCGSARKTPMTSMSCSPPSTRAERAPGRDIFPLPEAVLMPQTALRRADAICVGVRAAAADAAASDRAMRLAAFAIERDVQIVVLSESDHSGFERFGFRVERISGDSPEARAACEDQIRRFWNLDLVL